MLRSTFLSNNERAYVKDHQCNNSRFSHLQDNNCKKNLICCTMCVCKKELFTQQTLSFCLVQLLLGRINDMMTIVLEGHI